MKHFFKPRHHSEYTVIMLVILMVLFTGQSVYAAITGYQVFAEQSTDYTNYYIKYNQDSGITTLYINLKIDLSNSTTEYWSMTIGGYDVGTSVNYNKNAVCPPYVFGTFDLHVSTKESISNSYTTGKYAYINQESISGTGYGTSTVTLKMVMSKNYLNLAGEGTVQDKIIIYGISTELDSDDNLVTIWEIPNSGSINFSDIYNYSNCDHENGVQYIDNKDGTHDIACADCGLVYTESEDCTYEADSETFLSIASSDAGSCSHIITTVNTCICGAESSSSVTESCSRGNGSFTSCDADPDGCHYYVCETCGQTVAEYHSFSDEQEISQCDCGIYNAFEAVFSVRDMDDGLPEGAGVSVTGDDGTDINWYTDGASDKTIVLRNSESYIFAMSEAPQGYQKARSINISTLNSSVTGWSNNTVIMYCEEESDDSDNEDDIDTSGCFYTVSDKTCNQFTLAKTESSSASSDQDSASSSSRTKSKSLSAASDDEDLSPDIATASDYVMCSDGTQEDTSSDEQEVIIATASDYYTPTVIYSVSTPSDYE